MKFTRTPNVIDGSPYPSYRQRTRKDFRRFCAYCFRHEVEAGGDNQFVQDHFEPQSHDLAKARVFKNLYWCCPECNGGKNKGSQWPTPEEIAKGEVFCDSCHHDPETEDYDRTGDGGYNPKTPAGTYTVEALNLNTRPTIRATWAQRQREKALGTQHVALVERAIELAVASGAAESSTIKNAIEQMQPLLDALRKWLSTEPFVSSNMPPVVSDSFLDVIVPRR